MKEKEIIKWYIMAKVYDTDTPRLAATWDTKKQAVRVLERAFGKAENGVYTDSLGQRFWIIRSDKVEK